MLDGARVEVRGSTGARYELSRRGDVYACTCPAWLKQKAPLQQRTCKHLRAELGDDHEDRRISTPDVRPMRRESPALRARREAALTTALERFPVVAAKMREVYDMPLPRHLAYAAAFYRGLTAEERTEAWSYLGCGPAGILEWFDDDALLRPARADERLEFRYRSDPPEFVTVFSGNSDGGHWGLWYDDPRELPRFVAFNYARDDAVSYPVGPTLLSALHRNMTRERQPAREYPLAAGVLAWLNDVRALEARAHREEKIAAPPDRTGTCFAGIDPWAPGMTMPADLTAPEASDIRYKTFREAPDEAAPWIERARRELAEGQPLRALLFGRELHWVDTDPLRTAGLELLVGAYRALGRDALAEVARVHHANRDLTSVGIYGPIPEPPLAPLAAAAADDDVAALAALLAAGPQDAETVAAAVVRGRSIAALELLLPHATPAQLDLRAGQLIDELSSLTGMPEALAKHESLVEFLLAHGATSAAALARALAGRQSAMALRLAATVDPRVGDAEGATPLHHAAQTGDLEVARLLLARGADPEARDLRGHTPRDRARTLWQTHRAESLAVMALLQPTPPPVAPAGPPTVGERVIHGQFGAGIVEASEGAGDATKLRIRFDNSNSETRTLLVRFVKRAP